MAICLSMLFLCSSCSFNDKSGDAVFFPENGVIASDEIPEGPYARRIADWLTYRNAEEIISAANIVLIGKVVDIEFQVLDMMTALPVTESTPEYAKELHTIYNVQVMTSYKGDVAGTIKVRLMGGMVDYRVEEQLEVMRQGETFQRERGIPIWSEYYKAQCEIGGCYLFALYQFETGAPTPLNLEQAVYSLEEPTRKHVIGKEIKAYYSGDKDEYGRTLISAYDIITAFGSDSANEFNQNWKDNLYTAEK